LPIIIATIAWLPKLLPAPAPTPNPNTPIFASALLVSRNESQSVGTPAPAFSSSDFRYHMTRMSSCHGTAT
jgi:hypothetical protein